MSVDFTKPIRFVDPALRQGWPDIEFVGHVNDSRGYTIAVSALDDGSIGARVLFQHKPTDFENIPESKFSNVYANGACGAPHPSRKAANTTERQRHKQLGVGDLAARIAVIEVVGGKEVIVHKV